MLDGGKRPLRLEFMNNLAQRRDTHEIGRSSTNSTVRPETKFMGVLETKNAESAEKIRVSCSPSRISRRSTRAVFRHCCAVPKDKLALAMKRCERDHQGALLQEYVGTWRQIAA